MKNKELKKKICEIIAPYVSVWGEDERIADALIAAQIGDVSELKNHRLIAEYSLIPEDNNSYILPNTPIKVKQLYSGEEVEQIVKEREGYKHRAEVAERALLLSCADVMSDIQTIVFPKTKTQVSGKQELCDYYIKQAEKELSEEEKE